MQNEKPIDLLSAAFVAAQKEFKSAIKAETNPFFKSKYADLRSIWEAAHEALSKNDLAISQQPGRILSDPPRIELVTEIIHKSGGCKSSMMEIPITKLDPQAFGSAITYARRYALSAILGIVVDDDDGNTASHTNQKSISPKKFETISKEEAESLRELAVEMGWTDQERKQLILEYGLNNIMELQKDQVPIFEAHLKGFKK